MYISYLVDQSLKHGTIKVYLSAILNLQIASGRTDPFAGVAWPSPLILTKLKEAWSPRKDEYNTKMGRIVLILLRYSPSWGNDSAKQ